MKLKGTLSELRLYICNNIINKIPSHNIRETFYVNIMKFSMSKGASVHLDCKFDATGGLQIGARSVINSSCRIDTRGGVFIGDDVSISERVTILTASHDINSNDFAGFQRKVTIGPHAFIGTSAIILPGSSLGPGAVLGAGSVLTKAIPDFEVWAGVPARKIGNRNQQVDYRLNYRRFLH